MSESYKLIKQLGEGSHGKCYLVAAQNSREQCVIKQIDIRHMSQEEKQDTIKEASILGNLDHPYIIKLKEAYISKKGKLCIVMDFADGGDLNSSIKSRNGEKFPESQIIDWFIQIALALKHIHDRKILHRDLKSQNIFLTQANKIKVGDFGIAKVLNQTMENAKTVIGTPYSLSPELIDNKPYNYKSDIWALGILLYEMCALVPPFQSNSIHGLAIKIVRGVFEPLSNTYSKDLRNLVSSLLSVDPRQRPSIHEVLKSPLILGRIREYLTDSKYAEEFPSTVIKSPALFEEKSRKKRKRLLSKVNRRRQELDSPSLKGEEGDKEKILCEMTTLVLEEEETTSLSPDKKMILSRNEEANKANQFKECLEEIMGVDKFREVYSVIKNVDMTEDMDNYEVYYERLKHFISKKEQKKFLPMVKALIEMEAKDQCRN